MDLEGLLQTTNTTQLYRFIVEHIVSAADDLMPSGSSVVRKVSYYLFLFAASLSCILLSVLTFFISLAAGT